MLFTLHLGHHPGGRDFFVMIREEITLNCVRGMTGDVVFDLLGGHDLSQGGYG